MDRKELATITKSSGGVLRDLLTLARSAAEYAYRDDEDRIARRHVQAAVRQLGNRYLVGLGKSTSGSCSGLPQRAPDAWLDTAASRRGWRLTPPGPFERVSAAHESGQRAGGYPDALLRFVRCSVCSHGPAPDAVRLQPAGRGSGERILHRYPEVLLPRVEILGPDLGHSRPAPPRPRSCRHDHPNRPKRIQRRLYVGGPGRRNILCNRVAANSRERENETQDALARILLDPPHILGRQLRDYLSRQVDRGRIRHANEKIPQLNPLSRKSSELACTGMKFLSGARLEFRFDSKNQRGWLVTQFYFHVHLPQPCAFGRSRYT